MVKNSIEVPEVGQRVVVPWGLDTLPGTIVRIYESRTGTRVAVSIEVPGVSGDEIEDVTVTLPLASVQAESERHQREKPGQWVHALEYERELVANIGLMLRRIEAAGTGRLAITTNHVDPGNDLYIRSEHGRMVGLNIKHYGSRGKIQAQTIEQLTGGPRMVPQVLVTNSGLSAAAADLLRERGADSSLYWVQWRGDRDNENLQEVITALLS